MAETALEAVLAVESVEVRFGGVQALSGVDLRVRPGGVHGLIGPNGAGKTTLFNVICGLRSPTRGLVRLRGRDITRSSVHRRARMGIARTFQRLEICGSLSARENVLLASETRRRGAGARRLADALLERVGAARVADEPADALPTGLARLVEVARALATEPAVLLLDEPSAGLDEAETDALGVVLTGLAADGMAVLLVEHDVRLVMGVCNHVTVLDFGAVLADGHPDAVRADPNVQAAYLGTPPDGGVRDVRSPSGGPTNGSSATGGPRPAARGRAPAPRGPAPAIAVRDLCAGYDRLQVLDHVSLQVPSRAALALLGPNGAGKSTLLKVLSGCLTPTSGEVTIDGEPVRSGAPERLARRGVCLIPEGRAVFPNLTVAENLRICSYCGPHVSMSELEERTFARFPVLGSRRRQLAGHLSGGEQQMLALARALFTEPQVLLLDEISMGLAPIVVSALYELVGELIRQEDLTVVVVEQFAQSALEVASHAALMVNGRVVATGDPAQIGGELAAAYLGASSAPPRQAPLASPRSRRRRSD